MSYQPEEYIRPVAENINILHSSQNIQSPDNFLSHSQSINTIPSLHDYIVSEDLLAGYQMQGRMSNVRRFFCLFVTFDLVFTGLLWLICVMLKGENIMKAFDEQLYHYNIHTSLFDIVLAAFSRFVVLLLFYALIYLNHWIVISISTTLSCVFLVSKVVVYNWVGSPQPVFEVLLVLTSFVLSWGEAWFLDFRVLPQESNARRYLITNPESERAPLIQSYINGLPSACTESVGNFYSPMASPDGSLRGVNVANIKRPRCSYRFTPLTTEQESEYKTLAAQTLQEAWDLLNRKDWKLEKNKGIDVVYSMVLPKVRKIYKLKTYVKLPARTLLDELFYNVENLPTWNKVTLQSHKILILDEYTDVTYTVSADGAGGVVAKRDFVTLRHWSNVDGSYVIAWTAAKHTEFQETTKYVRGENGTSCMEIRPDPNNEDHCYFQWVLNTNLNFTAWLPQVVQDTALIGTMFDYALCLRNYIGDACQNGRFQRGT